MRITLGSQITIEEPTPDILAWCKKTLVIANPEYTKKMRMGFWVGNTPQTLSLYEKDGDKILLPYGCLYDIFWLAPKNTDLILDQGAISRVDFDANIPLYDYQEEAVEKMFEHHVGILQSPAGSGKTQTMLALACRLGVKTLWIAHTRDLVKQSKDRAELYMDKSLTGMITEGKVEIGEAITFATIQTLSNLDLNKYRDVWDCVIVDECHRISGSPTNLTMYAKVLNRLSARFKFGMTATVHRADGTIAATEALIGKVAHQVPISAVAEKIMNVSIFPRATHIPMSRDFLGTDGMVQYTKLISYLTQAERRNFQISQDLIANKDHYCLILSDRLEHLKKLMDWLPSDIREQAVMVDGKMTSKKAKEAREKAIEDMRNGEKHFLFASYALAKEGLDIPRLDRLFMATPQKDSAIVTQAIGRIGRTFEGKSDPVVYDYVDEKILGLLKGYKVRCRTYKKLNCKIMDGETVS